MKVEQIDKVIDKYNKITNVRNFIEKFDLVVKDAINRNESIQITISEFSPYSGKINHTFSANTDCAKEIKGVLEKYYETLKDEFESISDLD